MRSVGVVVFLVFCYVVVFVVVVRVSLMDFFFLSVILVFVKVIVMKVKK